MSLSLNTAESGSCTSLLPWCGGCLSFATFGDSKSLGKEERRDDLCLPQKENKSEPLYRGVKEGLFLFAAGHFWVRAVQIR